MRSIVNDASQSAAAEVATRSSLAARCESDRGQPACWRPTLLYGGS